MGSTKTSKKKLSSDICGIAGVYFVAGELSKRGYIALTTQRNTEAVDILVSNKDSGRSAEIQVKTNQGKQKQWILNEKAEKWYGPQKFYVLVNLNNNENYPDFHIVSSKKVANTVKREHKKWKEEKNPPRGKPHKDTPMRKFFDSDCKHQDRWEVLGLD